MELCISDLTAKYICIAVPLCWKWISYPWVVGVNVLISANKIPGIVNQSLGSLSCSYIKLPGELSWFCMLQLHMTNTLSKFLMN